MTNTSGDTVSTVSTGTVVVLTASVTAAGAGKVTLGTVNFCDPAALYCTAQHLFGSAQLTSNGTAVFKLRPGVGAHRYYAQFVGTTANAASPSDIESLTVTGGPFATTTSITQSGSVGNYALTATVSSANTAAPSPTGTIDFLDTTNSNYQLGDAVLAPGPAASSYAPYVSYNAGYYAQIVAVADFNQDGIPDLVVANDPNFGASPAFITILLGKGDGTFQAANSYPYPESTGYSNDVPAAIGVGDLNGDGYPDVVVAGSVVDAVYVYLNDGKGDGGLNGPTAYIFNLPSSGSVTTGSMGAPGGIAIADINNDGEPDVVVTFPQYAIPGSFCNTAQLNGTAGECSAVAVMRGNGDGTLQMEPVTDNPPWVPTFSSGFVGAGINPSEPIVIADLRGNGRLDAVTIIPEIGQVCVNLGNGDGTFANAVCYLAGGGNNVAVGDFNGDGIPDLVATTASGGTTSVLLGNGDGTFQTALNVASPTSPYSMTTGDMNGDGKLDLVITSVSDSNTGIISVLYGNGDGTFGSPNSYPGAQYGQSQLSVAAADLNGDGVLDIVGTDTGTASANVLLGSLSTSATATLTGVSPVGASTASHAVEASYLGDDYYSSSISATTSLTPQPVPTTLSLGSNTSTVTVGGQVTLTATVSPDSAQNYTPSGTVTFSMNGASIGTAGVSNGVATLTPSLTVVQSDSFTATYAGDSNFVGSSTSSTVQVSVQKATTTLAVTTSPSGSPAYGTLVQVTAVLSPSSIPGVTSTVGEPITFYDNGTVLGAQGLLSDGAATFVIAEPGAGNHSYTASYAGDANFIASTSPATALVVQKVATSMALTTNPVSPTTYGHSVVLYATFSPNLATSDTTNGETVTFYDNGASVGTATLNSEAATLNVSTVLPAGSNSFTVSYPGDGNFDSSTSPATALSVQKAPTTLSVAAPSSSTYTYGSSIPVQVFITPYYQSGGNSTNGDLVTLYQNGVSIGTAPLSAGTATFTANVPPVGEDAYSASYAGDASFASSTAAASNLTTVAVQPATTVMGITTSALHGIVGSGQPVTLTATLAPYGVTGNTGTTSTNGEPITFFNNSTMVGTGTLSNGVATFTYTGGLAMGSYSFTASYAGDANFFGSSTSYVALTVLQSTSLTLTSSPAHFGALNQVVTLTATLSPYTSGDGTTNGESIQFFDNNDQWGSATLSNGVATFVITSGLTQGSHSFTALYGGDAAFASSNTSASPIAFDVATIEDFVVNAAADDAGSAANCTPQSSTTSNTEDSACSLRDALLAAAAAPEGANITFAASSFQNPTTITLANGTLTVPANTTLTGPTSGSVGTLANLVTVNGNGISIHQASSTVFTVIGTGTSISNLNITGGWLSGDGGAPANGGGILNSGTLTLTNSTVTNNGSDSSGGGIYNTGTLTVVGSTIAGNTATANGPGNGGGIDNETNGTLTLINSTIANNLSPNGAGSGIAVGSGTATFTNTTISGNTGGPYGGIYNAAGTVTLANTIVSGNGGIADIEGSYTDQGGNVIGYANGNLINSNNLNLGPLGSYGGPTQTMLPLPGSSAICTGTTGNSPSNWQLPLIQIDIDQRGFPNYNITYDQLPSAGGSIPPDCIDSGAAQTNYTAVRFAQSSYTGSAGTAVNPPIVAIMTENGQSIGSVPLTLSYSGPGNLSGNSATTVQGAGATFPSLSVNAVGSGALGTTIVVVGTGQLSASTSLNVLPSLTISPGSETIFAGEGVPFAQSFAVASGSGSYQLTNSGTLPAGLTLSPSGTATGTGWTLSGTPVQVGSYNFTLTATDVTNSAVTISQTYTLSVAPATTTTLAASPASSATLGQTVTLTATVSSPTATGAVTFFDGGNVLGSGVVSISGGSPNTAIFALNASTLGSPLSFGAHSFTAQYSGDVTDGASTSNTVAYNVAAPNFVVNTTSDDAGAYTCATLASTTSNTTDGNNGGNPGLCTLRDALNTASASGAGSIYFDTIVFAASNLAGNPAANTIAANIPLNGQLTVQSNTTIQGLTSGSGVSLTNLVTVDGGGSGVPNNATTLVVRGTGAAINNLNINNGYASNGGNGGAITNFGSIVIFGTTFTGNQASVSGGGIYNLGGTLTVVNSTFASNSATGGNGGAIDNYPLSNCGSITVINSTFYRNTAANGDTAIGGAISNESGGCVLTVTNSTIDGNSADAGGGGVFNAGTLNLANSVVTGNTAYESHADDIDDLGQGGNFVNGGSVMNGNLIGVYNGAAQNGANISFAPLGNYGGPTQTMLPLPGSSAICAGLQSAIAFGVTTDQRGFGFVSPYCAAGTVDSGAVQTNYALSFSINPEPTVTTGVPIAPAPVVALSESGTSATAATSSITLSDTASALSGTTTAPLASGSAAFSNLLFTSAFSSDKLIATLGLNPGLGQPLSITAQSTAFQVEAPALVAASLIAPTPGSMLTAKSATFEWSSVAGATGYYLWIGTQGVGSRDIYNSAEKSASVTSYTFNGLPLTGAAIYVRLITNFNGVWVSNDYQYTVAGPVALTAPLNGTVLPGTSATFTWSASSAATGYYLWIGTQGAGSNDLYNSALKTGTSYTFNKMPLNGQPVYVRLITNLSGTWVYNDYQYTAGSPSAITSPAPNGTLPGPSATFTWAASSGATGYYLWIGTISGGNDIYNSAEKPASTTSYTFTQLPTSGQPIYVRLITNFNGTWLQNDYQYTAAGPAAMISPAQGSVLPGPNVTFNWTNNSSSGENVTGYYLLIGTQGVGSNDLYNSALKTGATYTFDKMPLNGQPIYVRLITNLSGTWVHNDYQYTAGSPAAITAPAPNGTLTGPVATFTWSASSGATGYYLWIGTTSGGNDIYNSAEKPASTTSYTFTQLPTNGQPVYVRLTTNFNGTWVYNDYQYMAK